MSLLHVEVAFALPNRQRLVALDVMPGTTAAEAVARADLPGLFPKLDPDTFARASLGIFGRALKEPAAHVLREGDRVEVYRPLTLDPKAARLARARRQQG